MYDSNGANNAVKIVDAGALDPLVALLTTRSSSLEYVTETLRYLAMNRETGLKIVGAKAVKKLRAMLADPTLPTAVRRQTKAALENLAKLHDA